MKTMTLVCGLPNAGKTTYCENYENVIHFDSINALSFEDKYNKCISEAVKQDGDVTIDGNFYSRRIRMNLLNAFKDKDYRKVCIWVNAPLETCLERSQTGGRDEEIVRHINEYFEKPLLDEGWDELIYLYGNEN